MGTTTGLEFEDICADILERCGFEVKKMGGTGDGGRDIIIQYGSNVMVVECKHQAKPTGRPVVQKLHSAVMTERAKGGIIISTGGFSPQASEHDIARASSDDVLDEIRYIRAGTVLLVDKEGLRFLARSAGVRLYDGEEPTAHDVDIEPLKAQFTSLKSHPKAPDEFMRAKIMGHRIDTCWIVDARIEQSFYNNSGTLIHKMKKSKSYKCGPDGQFLDRKLAKLVKKGGDASPKKANTGNVRKNVIADMKSRFRKNVKYKGKNGVTYSMRCEPGENYIRLQFKPVGIRQTLVEFKLIRRTYKRILPGYGEKITCRMCGESSKILKPLLVCNDCGMVAHAKSCGGKCSACKKTICDPCSVRQKGLLRSKLLCADCAY